MKPKKFTLRQVQYVVAVADRLGFRRAAKQCRVSQPALSSQVQRVEAALGVQLFERDRRGVRVTAGGAELLERMRQVLVAVDDLEAAARSLRDPLRGTLRIGVIPTIGPYLLPAASSAVRRELPRLTVEWTEDKTAVLLRRVRHGSLDGAFLALEAGTDDLAYEEVADDPFVLAMAPDHPLGQSSGPLPAARLRGEPILLLDEGHCLSDQVVEYCRHRGVDALGVRATSLPTLVQMVGQNLGITLLPSIALPAETLRADLAIREITEPAPRRTIVLSWRRTSPVGEAMPAVAEIVRHALPRTADEVRPRRGAAPLPGEPVDGGAP